MVLIVLMEQNRRNVIPGLVFHYQAINIRCFSIGTCFIMNAKGVNFVLHLQDGKSKVQKKGGKDKKKDGNGVVAEGKKKHKMEGEVSGQIKSQQPQFLSHKVFLSLPNKLKVYFNIYLANFICSVSGITSGKPESSRHIRMYR